MAISTNGAILTRVTSALYGEYLSNASYTELKDTAPATAAANFLTNDFAGKTDLQVANTILTNLGLTSITGLNNWLSAQLTAAGSTAAAKGAKLVSILNDYANLTTDATYGSYATSFNAKVEAGLVKSQTAGAKGGAYATADVVAVTNASLLLTSGVDLTVVGGAGSDTYTSVNTATSQTLNAGDSLDGGAGTDTLNITSTAALNLGTGVTSVGVENISLSASGGALTLDTAAMTGVTGVTNSGSTSSVSVSGLKALVPVTVVAASADTTVGFATAVTSGTADAISVNVNGVNTTGAGAVAVNADGFETVNVASSGSASGATTNSGVTIASNTLTTLNVTGDTAAKLTANLVGATNTVTGTVTSDAGAHDINITADATDKLSVSLGAGNDQLRVANIAATHTIAGGEGTDTLRYSGADAVTLANTANVTGFETVTLSNAAPASFAMTGAGVTTVTYTEAAAGTFGGLSTGGTVNLNKGGSVTAAAAGVAAGSTAAATTAAATYSGTADSLTVNVGAATTATGAASSTVSAVGVESVTFNSLALPTSTEARSVTFSDTTATTAALKSVTVTSSIPALTTVSVSNAGTSALTTVNLSGVTGGASFTGGATAGTSITGGAGNDALTGGAGPDNIIGGEGNDTINGAAGADTIDAGNGTNNITGGTGADTMTGGTGVDTYVFASNATTASTPVLTSTTSASDTITNFTSGTDKISITGAYAPTKFLGNFTNIQAALSYQAGANGLAYAAAYVTGENTLYVFQKTDGLLHADDLAIKLTNVTALAEGDLFLGSLATGGNSVTLTAANASVATSGTPVNARETTAGTNTPSGSLNTTAYNDTVTSTLANLAGATLTGGTGTDTLALSITAGQAAFTMPTTVTEFETITLANFAPAAASENTTFSVTLAAGNVAANTTLTVTNSNTGTDFDSTVGSNRTVFTGTNALSTSDRKLNYTGSAGSESITGGAGNDTITAGDGNDQIFGAAGTNSLSGQGGDDTITSAGVADSISGGDGADVINMTTAATAAQAWTISGGNGTDTLGINLTYDATSSTTIANTSVILTGSSVTTIEKLLGDGNDNRVVLGSGQVAQFTTVDGGGGTDILELTNATGVTSFNYDLSAKTTQNFETILLNTAGSTLTLTNGQATAKTLTGTSATGGDTLVLNGTSAAVDGSSFTKFQTITYNGTGTDALTLPVASIYKGTNGSTANDGASVITGSGTSDAVLGGAAADLNLTAVALTGFDGISYAATGNNTLTVDVADISGATLTSGGSTANLVIANLTTAAGTVNQDLSTVTITNSKFDSLQFGKATAGYITNLTVSEKVINSTGLASVLGQANGTENLIVRASGAAVSIDQSVMATAVTNLDSIAIYDGSGNNTITVASLDAARAITTVDLTAGGGDSLRFINNQTAGAASNTTATINGFTTGIAAGSDQFTVQNQAGNAYLTTADFITLSTAGTADFTDKVVEIATAIGTVNSVSAAAGGSFETLIAAAVVAGPDASAAAKSGYFLIYGSGSLAGNAYLVHALQATGNLSGGNLAATDITIEIVGTFTGITADAFVAGNFG